MTTSILLEQLARLSTQTTTLIITTPMKKNEKLPGLQNCDLHGDFSKKTSWSEVSILLEKTVDNCEKLLQLYMEKKKKIEESGEVTAYKKSTNFEMIEKNKKSIQELESQISSIIIEISYYESQRIQRNSDLAWLNIRSKEIDERKKSGNNYIPFYGIAYVIETNKMIDAYNRKLNEWYILNDNVQRLENKYHENLRKQKDILTELSRLTAENLKQEGENVKINELLTILSRLIVNFQSFLSEVQKVRNDLHYTSVKKANNLKIIIDRSYQEISQAQDLLNKKIEQYSSNIPQDILKEFHLTNN